MKPTRLQLAEHQTAVYYHVPEIGVTMEDLTAVSYWAHVAHTLRPGNRIEVLSAMGDWWAMLIVRSVGKHEAAVTPLQIVKLGEAEAITPPDALYTVVWRGPSAMWCVETKDGDRIKDKVQTREIAEQWVKNHEKAMAA